MQDAHAFLTSLTVVLAVAAVTTVVFQRLRQPVVLGYIIAGLIVGPHVPIPLVADPNGEGRPRGPGDFLTWRAPAQRSNCDTV